MARQEDESLQAELAAEVAELNAWVTHEAGGLYGADHAPWDVQIVVISPVPPDAKVKY